MPSVIFYHFCALTFPGLSTIIGQVSLKQKFPAGKLSAADKRHAGTDGSRSERGSDGAVKALLQKWNEISLVKRIICGLIIGAALGIFLPGVSVLTLLGNLPFAAIQRYNRFRLQTLRKRLLRTRKNASSREAGSVLCGDLT